jgi:hypothetical protein
VAGFIFLFLAFVGKFRAMVELPPERQKWAGIIGTLLSILHVLTLGDEKLHALIESRGHDCPSMVICPSLKQCLLDHQRLVVGSQRFLVNHLGQLVQSRLIFFGGGGFQDVPKSGLDLGFLDFRNGLTSPLPLTFIGAKC